MQMQFGFQKTALLFAVAGLAACGGDDENPPATVTQVSYQSLDPVKPLTVPATLRVPFVVPGMPAVVIVHGSNGIDSRGPSYAVELNKAGIATLEIDMWAPRGVVGAANRPRGVPETLPDAYGAFKYLASLPGIDAKRIGIMGFSWGGVVSMLTATKPYTEQYLGTSAKFVAHAPNYPVCWLYNRVPGYEFKSFTGAPVFIQGAELDTYDLPDTCPTLVQSTQAIAPGLVSVKMYPGVTHAWDFVTEPDTTITDPFSHLGRGGDVEIKANPAVAAQSRAATVAFFRANFGL